MLRPHLGKSCRKSICLNLIIAFVVSSLYVPRAQAGELVLAPMPQPGTMVALSPAFEPAHLQGVTIHPEDALKFDFLVNKGDQNLDQAQQKIEYNKLVKYFLASLTVPDKDQWVNLSPYEKDRIIENNFGKTEMGRQLLAQDYLLKQITSSLMFPGSDLGKSFWDKVYARAWKEFHTTDIPVNTFNKVWILPDDAVVYEHGNTAYIVKSRLRVMLEEDYLALQKQRVIARSEATKQSSNQTHTVASQVIREVILPAIEKEVNEGKNFAQLRQVVSGMILATWYKKALRESILGKIYADQGKLQGINQDPKVNEAIYQQYLSAFKKGVYNFIKEEQDQYTHESIPRKYFAGGVARNPAMISVVKTLTSEQRNQAMSTRVSMLIVAIYLTALVPSIYQVVEGAILLTSQDSGSFKPVTENAEYPSEVAQAGGIENANTPKEIASYFVRAPGNLQVPFNTTKEAEEYWQHQMEVVLVQAKHMTKAEAEELAAQAMNFINIYPERKNSRYIVEIRKTTREMAKSIVVKSGRDKKSRFVVPADSMGEARDNWREVLLRILPAEEHVPPDYIYQTSYEIMQLLTVLPVAPPAEGRTQVRYGIELTEDLVRQFISAHRGTASRARSMEAAQKEWRTSVVSYLKKERKLSERDAEEVAEDLMRFMQLRPVTEPNGSNAYGIEFTDSAMTLEKVQSEVERSIEYMEKNAQIRPAGPNLTGITLHLPELSQGDRAQLNGLLTRMKQNGLLADAAIKGDTVEMTLMQDSAMLIKALKSKQAKDLLSRALFSVLSSVPLGGGSFLGYVAADVFSYSFMEDLRRSSYIGMSLEVMMGSITGIAAMALITGGLIGLAYTWKNYSKGFLTAALIAVLTSGASITLPEYPSLWTGTSIRKQVLSRMTDTSKFAHYMDSGDIHLPFGSTALRTSMSISSWGDDDLFPPSVIEDYNKAKSFSGQPIVMLKETHTVKETEKVAFALVRYSPRKDHWWTGNQLQQRLRGQSPTATVRVYRDGHEGSYAKRQGRYTTPANSPEEIKNRMAVRQSFLKGDKDGWIQITDKPIPTGEPLAFEADSQETVDNVLKLLRADMPRPEERFSRFSEQVAAAFFEGDVRLFLDRLPQEKRSAALIELLRAITTPKTGILISGDIFGSRLNSIYDQEKFVTGFKSVHLNPDAISYLKVVIQNPDKQRMYEGIQKAVWGLLVAQEQTWKNVGKLDEMRRQLSLLPDSQVSPEAKRFIGSRLPINPTEGSEVEAFKKAQFGELIKPLTLDERSLAVQRLFFAMKSNQEVSQGLLDALVKDLAGVKLDLQAGRMLSSIIEGSIKVESLGLRRVAVRIVSEQGRLYGLNLGKLRRSFLQLPDSMVPPEIKNDVRNYMADDAAMLGDGSHFSLLSIIGPIAFAVVLLARSGKGPVQVSLNDYFKNNVKVMQEGDGSKIELTRPMEFEITDAKWQEMQGALKSLLPAATIQFDTQTITVSSSSPVAEVNKMLADLKTDFAMFSEGHGLLPLVGILAFIAVLLKSSGKGPVQLSLNEYFKNNIQVTQEENGSKVELKRPSEFNITDAKWQEMQGILKSFVPAATIQFDAQSITVRSNMPVEQVKKMLADLRTDFAMSGQEGRRWAQVAILAAALFGGVGAIPSAIEHFRDWVNSEEIIGPVNEYGLSERLNQRQIDELTSGIKKIEKFLVNPETATGDSMALDEFLTGIATGTSTILPPSFYEDAVVNYIVRFFPNGNGDVQRYTLHRMFSHSHAYGMAFHGQKKGMVLTHMDRIARIAAKLYLKGHYSYLPTNYEFAKNPKSDSLSPETMEILRMAVEERRIPNQAMLGRPELIIMRPAQTADTNVGGIDLNSANFNLLIKRDGRGMPLPVAQQDLAQLSRIGGFIPNILEIKPVTSLPFLE